MKKEITNDPNYDLKSVKLPYLAGGMLRLFVSLVEGPFRGMLIPSLFKSAGITWLRKQQFDEPPTLQPVNFTGCPPSLRGQYPRKNGPNPPPCPAWASVTALFRIMPGLTGMERLLPKTWPTASWKRL